MQQQPTQNLEGFKAVDAAPESYIWPAEGADLDDAYAGEGDSEELPCPQRGGFAASLRVAAAAKQAVSLASPVTENPAPADSAEGFFGALLAESIAIQKDKTVLKDSRAKLKDTRVSGAERAKLESTVREIELVQEWSAVSNVVLFNEQHCTYCGKHHTTFSGLFQRQVSRTSKINRWQAVKGLTAGLRKESKHTVTEVPICHDCAGGQEWGPEREAVYVPSAAKSAIVEAAEKAQNLLDKFLG